LEPPLKAIAGHSTGVLPKIQGFIFIAVALLATAACGAPESEPAKGPIGDQVRASLSQGTEKFDHTLWHQLLESGTRNGRIDYAYVQRNRETLDVYLDRVGQVDIASLSPDQLKALLINAYNALTVKSILDNPGVDSIREIEGVWKKTRHELGGFQVTLDEIEHNLLRPFFKDPRIHFAVNCASTSCAPLPRWAADGGKLEEQLEQLTREFLSDERNVFVQDGVLHLSKYFEWYGDDFIKEGWKPRAESVPGFVAGYTREEVSAFIRDAGGDPTVEYLDYDWSLNAIKPPNPG
jgi:hypothetical protein